MRPLDPDLVRRLDLELALEVEATTVRDLMPEEPAWKDLALNAKPISDWIRAQLLAGHLPSPQAVVGARKAGHGVRPIAVLHQVDRIIYRALTSLVLAGRPIVDRSRQRYLDFVVAPIRYSLVESLQIDLSDPWATTSRIQYVVKSDVSSFYQYIDHEILAKELMLQTGEFAAIEALIDFLADLQGRRFGLPQQLQASHELSEYYIDIAERRMIREGFPIWRYNDDFRIATQSYGEALRAVDALSAVARELGLVISEHKTSTPSLRTYVYDNTGLTADDAIPSDISAEDAVGDYLEELDESTLEEARQLIGEASPVADAIKDGSPSLEDVRKLRRTIAAFRLEEDPGLTSEADRIVAYVASLTPDVARYLSSLDELSQVADAVDSIITGVSLNEWQELWMIDVIRRLNFLDDNAPGDVTSRQRWVRKLSYTDRSPVVRAYCFWTLASAELVTAQQVDFAMREAPSCLSSWYLAALKALSPLAEDKAAKLIKAVRAESRLHGWILS
ncbi:RNA-directed DNA polymerase [Micromonospora aurantiaca]|uniref:RNA-directed DNA polymerase n=1 Tax=Micromonospora aurantiaca (nom. illeg.) TaxID=47850 RepID=UPI0037B3126B